ncbi:MAG: 50S ribosomal protein L11 methyltransferase [Crocinitomicaceae bacterium]
MQYIEIELDFEEVNPWQDIATALLAEIEFESFVNTDKGVKAYIQKDLYSSLSEVDAFLSKSIQIPFEIKETIIEDQNWNAAWESNFDPIYIEKELEIVAPFHTPENLKHTIIINPQMSFGTGHHETTRMISRYLLKANLKEKKILDMGTGTGVLAILAEQLGAKDILAVDIEEWAFNNAKENLSLNNCSRIRVLKGDIDVVCESDFDSIIANINKNVLLGHLKHYAEKLKSGGLLYLSGFFHSDVDDLVTNAESCGFKFEKEINENDWSALQFEKM